MSRSGKKNLGRIRATTILPYFIALLAAGLGFLYSVYSTDPHHWGFILGAALDFIQGRELFSEVYVQYGAGELVILKLLGLVIPITVTTIGFVTSLVFAATLLLLHSGMRKLGGELFAICTLLILFLVHSYAIYPWPDYYGGLFLALGATLLIRPSRTGGAMICGLLFFLSFLCRNTYLVSLTSGFVAYLGLCVLFPKIRERRIFIAIATYAIAVAAYLAFLAADGKLGLWYRETIGAGSSQYGVGVRAVALAYREAFFPSTIPNLFFSIFVYLGFLSVVNLVLRRRAQSGLVVLFSLVGLAGIVQAALYYEMFRLFNACLPLFLAGAATLGAKFAEIQTARKSRWLAFAACWFTISFSFSFPRTTAYFGFFDGRIQYAESAIPAFRWHRFSPEVAAYYEGLERLLCDGTHAIVNRTLDAMISRLCPGQKLSLRMSFFAPDFLKVIDPEELDRQLRGEFRPDELIVADGQFSVAPGLKLAEIGQVSRPAAIHFMPPAVVKVFRVERAGQ